MRTKRTKPRKQRDPRHLDDLTIFRHADGRRDVDGVAMGGHERADGGPFRAAAVFENGGGGHGGGGLGNGRDGVFREIDDFRLAVHHVAEKRFVMRAGNRNTIVFNDIGVPFVRSMADGQFAGGKDGGIVADDNRGGLFERRLVKRRHGNRLDGGDGDFAVVHARIDAEAGIIGKPRDDDAFGDPFVAAFVGETSLAGRRETGAVEDRDAFASSLETEFEDELIIVAVGQFGNDGAFDPRVFAAGADGVEPFVRRRDGGDVMVAEPSAGLFVAEVEEHGLLCMEEDGEEDESRDQLFHIAFSFMVGICSVISARMTGGRGRESYKVPDGL